MDSICVWKLFVGKIHMALTIVGRQVGGIEALGTSEKQEACAVGDLSEGGILRSQSFNSPTYRASLVIAICDCH